MGWASSVTARFVDCPGLVNSLRSSSWLVTVQMAQSDGPHPTPPTPSGSESSSIPAALTLLHFHSRVSLTLALSIVPHNPLARPTCPPLHSGHGSHHRPLIVNHLRSDGHLCSFTVGPLDVSSLCRFVFLCAKIISFRLQTPSPPLHLTQVGEL